MLLGFITRDFLLFWKTSLGGVETVTGETNFAPQNIYYAQKIHPNYTGLSTYGSFLFARYFATMMFGLPVAALDMYHAMPKGKRAKKTGFYFSRALTSILIGIIEQLEFFILICSHGYVLYMLS